ncbi:MAG: AAA family ATPase, partial [Tunicatimonas sp.]|uniref:AAA family ATPase n=1 Tax=Tunicatimonas sp. TaxID=1940096 RepID=UPI003C767CE0
MEKIIIKNFGPIKDIELEIKDINVFIGSTSSGKSTVAKLISIFRDSAELIYTDDFAIVEELLSDYNINYIFQEKTYIEYIKGEYSLQLKSNEVHSNLPFKGLASAIDPNREMAPIISSLAKSMMSGKASVNKLISLALLSIDSYDFDKIEVKSEGSDKKVNRFRELVEKVKNNKDQIINDEGYYLDETMSYMAEINDLVMRPFGSGKIIYIPAERILLSLVAESIFGLMNNDVSIAKCIKQFGTRLESARKKNSNFSIPFLEVSYVYSDKSNFVTFDDRAKVKLEQASSGLQSIIPLLLVIESNTSDENIVENCFVIEEPELNLYPTVQKELVEFIIERINKHKDKLIITTHSPYVLTS